MVEQRVVKAVVCNRVTLGQLSPGEFGVGRRIPAEQEERCPHAFARERVQHRGGGARPRAVVEGQHHLLVRQRQSAREMLATDPRRGRGIDGQHPRGPQCPRVAGAGRSRLGRSAQRDRQAHQNGAD